MSEFAEQTRERLESVLTFLTTLFVDEGQMTPLFYSSCHEHATRLTWETNTNLHWTGCRWHDISRLHRRRVVKRRKGGLKKVWELTMMIVVSLTWMSECGVSDAGILSMGEKEWSKLICNKGQPHCLQSALQIKTRQQEWETHIISSLLNLIKELDEAKRPPLPLIKFKHAVEEGSTWDASP